jgi:hypothetical protein
MSIFLQAIGVFPLHYDLLDFSDSRKGLRRMQTSDLLQEKLGKSLQLYKRMQVLSHEMDANLTRWGAARISEYYTEAQKLQSEIQDLDLQIKESQGAGPIPAACRELHLERSEIIRDVLLCLDKNKKVVSRMLTMLADDLSKNKNFRNAAGGYFKKSRMTGRTLERTA